MSSWNVQAFLVPLCVVLGCPGHPCIKSSFEDCILYVLVNGVHLRSVLESWYYSFMLVLICGAHQHQTTYNDAIIYRAKRRHFHRSVLRCFWCPGLFPTNAPAGNLETELETCVCFLGCKHKVEVLVGQRSLGP